MRHIELRQLNPRKLHRCAHGRILLLVALSLVVAASAAGLAFARSKATAIGTGVVVIDTNLGYEGGEAAGTGMVLTSSGEILTNNHVIRGATTIKIVVPGTAHTYTATVVGYDVAADVAVLKATNASNLKAVSPGSSTTVKVGQNVTAVGNAGGTGALTSTTGRVTGVSRSITVSDDSGLTENLSGLIETNARLEPGDSGGPLLNSSGKVIGMDAAASVSGGPGFQQIASTDGYAIPINKVESIVKVIVAGESSTAIHIGGTAFLGVELAGNGYGSSGATIAGVASGGAADAAGLTAGDTIIEFDGHSVTASNLTSLLFAEKPGARVTVIYLNQTGATQTATVTLASGPPQ